MEFSGERYVPELGGEIRLEHVHRYAFCLPYVKGKDVLDAACGEGYGSAYLARHARSVLGVDIAAEAVQHARQSYAGIENLRYEVADACALTLPEASFDVVVSFETLEHVLAQEALMQGFSRVLKPSGLLLISSPDKRTYSDIPGYRNEFHVKELYRDEFEALIGRHFRRHRLLGQRLAGGSAIFPLSEEPAARARKPQLLVDDGRHPDERGTPLGEAVYLLAVATNGSGLPSTSSSMVLSSTDDPLLELRRVARWASGVHKEMEALRASAAQVESGLRDELAEARRRADEGLELADLEMQRVRSELNLRWGTQLRAARDELDKTTARLVDVEEQLERSSAEADALRERVKAAETVHEAEAAGLREALAMSIAMREEEVLAHRDELDRLRSEQAVLQTEQAAARTALEQQLDAASRDWERERQRHAEQLRAAKQQADERYERWQAESATLQAQLDTERNARQRVEETSRQTAIDLTLARAATETVEEALAQARASASSLAADLEALRTRHTEERERDRHLAAEAIMVGQAELAEARRQLQQAHLARQRQAENATRGLQELQQDHARQLSVLETTTELLRAALRGVQREAQAGIGQLRRNAAPLRPFQRQAAAALALLQDRAEAALRAAADRGADAAPPLPSTLPELLALDDDRFVTAAYLTVLHRGVDASGRAHYLRRLRDGEERLRVLSDLRHSTEGRSQQPAMAALDEALAAFRVRNRPLVGHAARERLAKLTTGPGVQPAALAPDAFGERLARIELALNNLGRGSSQLAEAVPIAVSLGRAPAEWGLDSWACAQELVRADDNGFLQLAHLLLLRRAPEAEELERDIGRLRQGASRAHLIDLLLDVGVRVAQPLAAPAPALGSLALVTFGASAEVPASERPDVSIVVAAVAARADLLLRSLRSIARQACTAAIEVITVVDEADDDLAGAVGNVKGLRIIKHHAPCSAAGLNAAARTAKGEYLVFMAGDVEAQANWMDELQRSFLLFAGAAAVGSLELAADGRVAEAGGTISRTGRCQAAGRGAMALPSALRYAREVDYCSERSLMVDRLVFDAVGGFDERLPAQGPFAAAFALALRARGYRVMYQPLSVVRDLRVDPDADGSSRTSGQAASDLLRAEWPEALQQQHDDDTETADRWQTRRLLALEHHLPRPDRDAGSVSVVNMLLVARGLGFRVTLVAEDIEERKQLDPRYVEMLERAGIEVISSTDDGSIASTLEREGADLDAVLLFRPAVMERHVATVRRSCPKAVRLYYPHDLHFLRLARQAAVQGDEQLALEAERRRPAEIALQAQVHRTIVASRAELTLLQEQGAGAGVSLLPLLLDTTRGTRAAKLRTGMLFVGSFQHAPNVAALRNLVEEVMPRVRALRSDIELVVIGENAPPEIVDRRDEQVRFAGAVDDLDFWFERTRVAVAPLPFGAGAKGKVARALAAGVPVVASPLAVEGMDLTPDEHVIVVDNAEAFADAVIRLHDDGVLWQRLADNGHRFAVEHWGARAAGTALAQIMQETGIETEEIRFTPRLFRESLHIRSVIAVPKSLSAPLPSA